MIHDQEIVAMRISYYPELNERMSYPIIYIILYSALVVPYKKGYRLYDCTFCFVDYRIYCGINNVLGKHNLDTPQRKRRERVWQTMELFYISPIRVNDPTLPLTC